NVAIGFNWSGGTSTFSAPAGAWTPLTVVKFAPALVTSGYQVIGPTASAVTIDVTAAVAAGQVDGQLIAANTITAAQIAANTITAAQIAASTITATQIAAGTITAANLVSNIVVAGIVDATTITGATFIADGTAGEILVYSGAPTTGNLVL